jgi:hypothetical protein
MTGKVKTLIEELVIVGAKVIVKKCDVANSGSVDTLIKKEMAGMPEIKGVIHGAMVLKVSNIPRLIMQCILIILRMCSLKR